MQDDIAASGAEIADDLGRTSRRIDEFQDKLADERVSWQSPNGLFAIIVDGNGRLLDLDIAPQVFDTAQPERAGGKIVRAIQEARAAAVEVSRRQWKEEFGGTELLDGFLPRPNPSRDR